MPQFEFYQHQGSRETLHGAAAVRHTTRPLQIFRPVFAPPVTSQALRRYDLLGAKLQLSMLTTLEWQGLNRLRDNPLFPVRSTQCLRPCHRKHCAPSRGERLRQAAKTQNCNALTVQLIPMQGVPLRQDYVQSGRESRQNTKRRLMSSYHSALSLARSLS